jgi:hemoglobin
MSLGPGDEGTGAADAGGDSAGSGRPPYEQLGGEAGIVAVLDELYAIMFDDPMVGFLFAGHDREKLVRSQALFTRRMLGDTAAVYEGKSIPDAHAALPILAGHFDRRHHLLGQVLARRGVPEAARLAWLRLDQGLRTSVLKVGRARTEALRSPREDDPGR